MHRTPRSQRSSRRTPHTSAGVLSRTLHVSTAGVGTHPVSTAGVVRHLARKCGGVVTHLARKCGGATDNTSALACGVRRGALCLVSWSWVVVSSGRAVRTTSREPDTRLPWWTADSSVRAARTPTAATCARVTFSRSPRPVRLLVHAQNALSMELPAEGAARCGAREPALVPRVRPAVQRPRHDEVRARDSSRTSTRPAHCSMT